MAQTITAEPSRLPALPNNVRLPANYLAAKAALAACESLDECRHWSDKAAAIEAYAFQARDPSLMRLARRIRLRAIRRCGELLGQLPMQRGRRTDRRANGAAGTRTAAAKAAGLTTHDFKTASRIAKIPAGKFEEAVESEEPPGVARLAGRAALRTVPLPDDPEETFERARGLLSALLVTYRAAPPLVRRRILDMIARAFLDAEADPTSPLCDVVSARL